MTNKADHTPTLNWDVKKVPAFFTPDDGITRQTKKAVLINSSTYEEISQMTDKYHIFYNRRFVQLAELMAEVYGLEISHYTTYKGGKGVLVAFKQPKESFYIGDFQVDTTLVIANNHDGTGTLRLGVNEMLHRCENMFASTDYNLKIFHNSTMDDAVENLQMEILKVNERLRAEFEEMNRWKNVKISPKLIQQAKEQILRVDGTPLSTAKTNKLLRFDAAMEEELTDLGQNAFAGFNGFTKFTTHFFDAKGGSLDVNKDFPLWGERARINHEAKAFFQNVANGLITA